MHFLIDKNDKIFTKPKHGNKLNHSLLLIQQKTIKLAILHQLLLILPMSPLIVDIVDRRSSCRYVCFIVVVVVVIVIVVVPIVIVGVLVAD